MIRFTEGRCRGHAFGAPKGQRHSSPEQGPSRSERDGAAALGNGRPISTPFFQCQFGWAKGPAKLTLKKGGVYFAFLTQGGASLALGYYHVVPTGLQFGSLRSRAGRNGTVPNSASGMGLGNPSGIGLDNPRHWLARRPGLSIAPATVARDKTLRKSPICLIVFRRKRRTDR